MTYVDPSNDLPWYMRNAGPAGPPSPGGPTGSPSGGAPQGSGGGQGGGMAWLQYMADKFGVSPQALMAKLGQGGQGAGGGQDWQGGMLPSLMNPDPSQQPYQTAGLGWAGPPGYDQAARLRSHLHNANTVSLDDGPAAAAPAPATGAPPQPTFSPLAGGSANTGVPVAAPPAATQTRPARPAGVGPSGTRLDPGSLSPAALAQFNNPAAPGGYAPWPSGGGSMGPGMSGPLPAPNPAAAGGAGGAAGSGATANPRFTQIDRPNIDPLMRGRMGNPQMTALNLAGLFGGGQPAANPNPNAPAANAQPVAATRPVPGPLANPKAPGNASMNPAAVASAVGKPNWWQNLGFNNMNPDQLARTVRQPNWWRNV